MQQNGLEEKITTVCADMAKMPFDTKSFDLIWSEGSAYIMGVKNALKAWKPLLSEDGVLVVSDLVWSTDKPSESALSFWKKNIQIWCQFQIELSMHNKRVMRLLSISLLVMQHGKRIITL